MRFTNSSRCLSAVLVAVMTAGGLATPDVSIASSERSVDGMALHSAAVQSLDFSSLDQIANDELKARKTPGAAIAVIRGGKVAYVKGYGVTSVETNVPVTPEFLFRLGSTTKMLTAAAAVSLVAAGKLQLDEPISKYVKGLNPRLGQLNVHQLLSQSSGLRDFAATKVSNDETALSEQPRAWKEDVFFTDPGRVYSYSSAGYWLAGAVIEGASTKLYADVLDELLFKPLGMTRTTLRPLVALTYPLTMGHRVEGQGSPTVIRPAYNNTAMWPGGSVYSNVGDLSRFVIALMDSGRIDGQQILPSLIVSKLPAPQMPLPGEEGVSYGYGVLTYEHRGVRIVTHGGASTGYGSSIVMAPETRDAVIVLTNKSGETLARTREKALELILPLKPRDTGSPTPRPPLAAAELGKYTGSYLHAPQTWEVISRGGVLVLKTEGEESVLTRTGETTFSYGAGNSSEVVFVAGPDGDMDHIFLGLYSARRVPAAK